MDNRNFIYTEDVTINVDDILYFDVVNNPKTNPFLFSKSGRNFLKNYLFTNNGNQDIHYSINDGAWVLLVASSFAGADDQEIYNFKIKNSGVNIANININLNNQFTQIELLKKIAGIEKWK